MQEDIVLGAVVKGGDQLDLTATVGTAPVSPTLETFEHKDDGFKANLGEEGRLPSKMVAFKPRFLPQNAPDWCRTCR